MQGKVFIVFLRCSIRVFFTLCLVLLFPNATECIAADDQVLMLKMRHIFLGELVRCINQKGISCEFKTLGFEDIYTIEDPEKILIFNRGSKLYYKGNANNNSNLNRASILVGISGRADSKNFSWGNEKWSPEKIENIAGAKCSYFETKKNQDKWQIWISKEYKLPNKAYSIVGEWLRLPNLNGLPVRAVRTNQFGTKTVVLECLAAKKIPAPQNFLKTPPGLKRVNNVTEVCAAKDSLLNDVLDTLK